MLPNIQEFKGTLPTKYQDLSEKEIERIRNYIYGIVYLFIKDPIKEEKSQLQRIQSIK